MRRLPGTSRKAVLLPLVLTTAIHLGILLLAVAAPKLIPEHLRIPEVYLVELYSAPPAPPEPPVPQPPQPALNETPHPATSAVASLPKARVKANIAPLTVPPPARAKAISLTPLKERLARETREREEAELNRQLTERMARLRLDLQEQKAAEQARAATRLAREAIAEAYRIAPTRTAPVFEESPPRNPINHVAPGPDTSAGTNAPSAKQLEAQAAYIARLKDHLRRHWKLPVLQDWDEKLSATMLIRIKRDGSVLSTGFEKHSTNPRFDQYVKKAVDQSSPLPALPREFEQKSEEIAVTFTPGGLK